MSADTAIDVSIIIPVYQRQRPAEAAIQSALQPCTARLEVIVIDDGSPVPFVLPASAVRDPRVRLIRHDANQGAASARNTGIAAGRGEWLAFLDSDDVWLPGKLDSQLAFANTNDVANKTRRPICYVTGFILENETTGNTRALIPIESDNPVDFASGCWFAPGSTAMIHRNSAALIGPMDVQLSRFEDTDWYLRMALSGGCLKVVPILGARIATGHKNSPAVADRAAAGLAAKWVAPHSSTRLPWSLRRRMRAYIDLERASARWYAGRRADFLFLMGRSLLHFPRARVQLRRWWDVGPTYLS